MISIPAFFYDGQTSDRQEILLSFEPPGHIRLIGMYDEMTYPLSNVRITSRLGSTPRYLYFPNGTKCETLHNDEIDVALAGQEGWRWHRVRHHLESRSRYILLALLLAIAVPWGFIHYAIPAMAKQVAHTFPQSMDAMLGQQSLLMLDETVFSPTALDETRQQHYRMLLGDMVQQVGEGYALSLEFRTSDLVGANALALPSGIIILTDEFLHLAEDDKEIVAVLAHEIGHVVNRHTLRHLLQHSAVVLLIASVTGDMSSVASLSAVLPVLLLQAKYSRAFEIEADDFAFQFLKTHQISTKHFANILMRLDDRTDEDDPISHFIATHPATRERVQRFLENQ